MACFPRAVELSIDTTRRGFAMLKEHREDRERAAKDRYAQAARELRRYAKVAGYGDPTVRKLDQLLYAAATVLEAAGHNPPTGQLEAAAVEALAGAVERLQRDGRGLNA